MDMEEHYQPYISTASEGVVNGNIFINPELLGLEASTSAVPTHGTLALNMEFEEGIEDLDSQGHRDTSPQKIRNKIESHQGMDSQENGSETSILKSLLSGPIVREETDNQRNSEEESPLPECTILLEDCKSFLQNNPCFCKECNILFPTDNDFDAHRMISHSFLVAVTKNKAVKSTSKSFDGLSDNCNLLCNHCDVVFPNTIALLSHTYNLLPGKFACDKCDMVFENDAACKQHKVFHYRDLSKSMTAPTVIGLKYLICRICSCHFKFAGRYIAHMKNWHDIEETAEAQRVYSNLQCRFCLQKNNSSTQFFNSRVYNKHIVRYHSSLYQKRCTNSDESSQFKCPKCHMFFSSEYSVRIHLAAKHGNIGTAKNSKKLASSQNKSSKNLKNYKNFLQVPSSRNIETWPLSKSTLFKCNKCQVHFVSCLSAVVHSHQCRAKKDFFQCAQCNRSIKSKDRFHHNYQHSVSNKFKVIVVSRNILNRILCKCTTCNICFDERSFLTHHTNVCDGETASIHCKECKTWIHTKAMAIHKKIHTRVASKEFIIVDFIHAETSVKKLKYIGTEENGSQDPEVKTVIDSENSKEKPKFVNKIKRKDLFSYFFCPTCKCNMKVNRGLHHTGKCNPRTETVICKLCGLRFTDKGMQTHKLLHEKFPKLKLKDLKFINMQTDRIINAPFPNFKKCKRCNVTFYSSIALRSHTCHDEAAKACKYCSEKLSDVAYKLHVPYHEYAMTSKKANVSEANNIISKMNEKDSELIKKYESLKQVWNILYLCQACDIVMDDYDQVVEHCQDHFCNMQSYNVTIEHCDTCDLNFVDSCYKKHKELHINSGINKESFKLIEYFYENLLLDSWMDIFRTLTKEQINLILSKSIYRFTRCLRMKVVTNGSTDFILHQCGVCGVIVPSNKVNEHAQNINGLCEGSQKFKCSHCTLTFAYKRHRDVHEILHTVRKMNAASFKIAQFHAEKQFSATVVRKNDKNDQTDSHSLKFIRCQRCGKLISKHKYKMHTQNHRYYETYKHKHSKPRQRVGAKPKFCLKFFVCKSCNLCVSSNNIRNHLCDNNYSTKKCTRCSLLFRNNTIASHYGYHAKYSFNSSKINVIYFENGIILNNSDNAEYADNADARTVPFNEEKWVGNKNIKKKAQSYSKIRHALKRSRKPNLKVMLKNKVMAVYQCAECNACLWHRSNLRRHICVAESYRAKCGICGLTQHTAKGPAHMRLHEVRNFDASNLKYIKFRPGSPLPNKSRSVNTALPEKRKPLATFEETDSNIIKRQKLDTNITEHNDEVSDHYSIAETSGISEDLNVEEEEKESKTTVVNKIRVDNAKKKEKPFEKSRSFTDFIYNRYYKCKRCKLLFVTCTGLVEHEDVCSKNREAVKNGSDVKSNEAIKCSDCKLVFHASMIEQHKILQKCKQHLAERVVIITIKQKGKSHNNPRNWLYVCATCNVYNISFYGMRYHFQNNHQCKYALKTCTDCNITLSSTTFKRHANLCHRSKAGISDFYIASVEDTNLEEALENLSDDKDVVYVDEGLYKEKCTKDLTAKNGSNIEAPINLPLDKESNIVTDDSINNGSPKTYTCSICQLNFVTPSTLLSHYKRGVHNQKHVSCDLCGLNFTGKSIDKHMLLHHKDQKLKDKNVEINDVVQNVTSSLDKDSQNYASSIKDYPSTSEDINASSKLNDKLGTETVIKENIETENHENGIENSSNININKTKDGNSDISDFVTESKNISMGNFIVNNSPRSNEIQPNTVSNTINIELNKNKLYKCSQCDVYYLTADDCSEHTNNHTQLDPTEYIACKICDLQFCCEYLGRHMKSHREKTFCIDDLIVAEYRIEHGDVKVDTYLAVDRLKTKLVTTTTNFDTVDSTTAESS